MTFTAAVLIAVGVTIACLGVAVAVSLLMEKDE